MFYRRLPLVMALMGALASLSAADSAPIFTPERDASFLKFVEAHIQKADAQGGLRIYDPVLQKNWTLQLVKILPKTLLHKYTRRFQVAAEFKSKEGGKDVIEVLFDSDWEDTDWDMEKVTLNKVNGEMRPH